MTQTIKKQSVVNKKTTKNKLTKAEQDKLFNEILDRKQDEKKYDNKNIDKDKLIIEEQCKKLLLKLIAKNNILLMKAIDDSIYDNFIEFNKLSIKNISFEEKLKTMTTKVFSDIKTNKKYDFKK